MAKFRRKTGVVEAYFSPRPVGTQTDHGFVENEGVWVITSRELETGNVDREVYFIRYEKFTHLYEPIDEEAESEVARADAWHAEQVST